MTGTVVKVERGKINNILASISCRADGSNTSPKLRHGSESAERLAEQSMHGSSKEVRALCSRAGI